MLIVSVSLTVVSCSDKGDIQESLRYHLKALAMREKTLGPDHPDTGISCAGVGSLYDCDKKYRLAVEYYSRSLPALEKSGHPQVHELRERIEVLKSLVAE